MGFNVAALCKEIEEIYDALINLETETPSGEKKNY